VNLGKILAAGALALVLGACSSESTGGEPSPSPSSSRTPSASASPTAPPATAEATVRAFVEAMDEMYLTGDPEPVEALSVLGCEYCAHQIAFVKDLYRAGGDIRASDQTLTSIRHAPEFPPEPRMESFIARLDSAPNDYKPKANAAWRTDQAKRNEEWFFQVRKVAGQWKVVLVGRDSQ